MKKMGFTMILTATTAILATAPLAAAAEEGKFQIGLRGVNIDADSHDDGYALKDHVAPEVSLGYFFTPRISTELAFTIPGNQPFLDHGVETGSVKQSNTSLTARYHFNTEGTFRPYVGLGAARSSYSNVNLPANASINNGDWGWVAQTGIDMKVANNLYLNVDLKKQQQRSDIYTAANQIGELKVNPLKIGVGLTYRF